MLLNDPLKKSRLGPIMVLTSMVFCERKRNLAYSVREGAL